jgi:Flp pilus assembly protein TadG
MPADTSLRKRRILRASAKVQAHSREKGAAVVEAAIITPLFIALILAIFEFGPLFLGFGASRNAVSEGVRQASIVGSSPSADYDVVQAMRESLKNLGPDLDYIIVYKGKDIKSGPPVACITAAETGLSATDTNPVGAFDGGMNLTVNPSVKYTPETYDWGKPAPVGLVACNVYYRRMFDVPKARWLYDKSTAAVSPSLDRHWPGSARVDYQSGPQDFVGIFVQHKIQSPTGFFKSRTVRNTGIVRIEPVRANK